MTPTTLMSLFVATGFVLITLFGAYYANKIFKVRMAHEEKVYAQREVLIDLLTKADQKVVDEAVREWLDNHLVHVRQDIEDELERAYGNTIRSIMNDPTRPLGGSHDQPERPV